MEGGEGRDDPSDQCRMIEVVKEEPSFDESDLSAVERLHRHCAEADLEQRGGGPELDVPINIDCKARPTVRVRDETDIDKGVVIESQFLGLHNHVCHRADCFCPPGETR